MRNIFIVVIVATLLVAGCSPRPSTPQPSSSSYIIEEVTPTEQTPLPTQTTVPPVAAVAYGCAHTGISLGYTEVIDVQCNLDTQVATFTLANGATLSVALFSTPINLVSGDTATIVMFATNTATGEEANCSLMNEYPRTNLKSPLVVNEDINLRAECAFKDGFTLTMGYAVRPVSVVCVPQLVWEADSPADLVLDTPGNYAVELAFPLVTNLDAYWVNTLGSLQIEPADLPLYFTGAVGTVYLFSPECDDSGRFDWRTKNLTSSPTQLEIWKHAGVLK